MCQRVGTLEVEGMIVEFNEKFEKARDEFVCSSTLIVTPPISREYWLFRVKLHGDQAIVAFPKFRTIGVGFALEKYWNTNLPYVCEAETICDHIWGNREYECITRSQVIEAIKEIQGCCAEYEAERRDA